MIEVMERFLKRGSRPITTIATAFGGGYLVLSYLQSKLTSMNEHITQTRVCTENLQRRFEQNQQDCCFTVLALIPTLSKQVTQSMNVEALVQVLNQTKSRPRPSSTLDSEKENSSTGPELANGHSQILQSESENQTQSMVLENSTFELNTLDGSSEKSQPETSKSSQPGSALKDPTALLRPDGSVLRKRSEIWTEMMLVTFSRLFTCLYGLTLLTLQTHIQLGLLGRDLYLSSILSTENFNDEEELGERLLVLPTKSAHNMATERQYLTFSWWYLHKGWTILSRRIRSAVEEVLSSRSLKDTISLSDLLGIFNLIRSKVEFESDGTEYNFDSILLPTTNSDEIQTLNQGGMPPHDCEVDARLRTLLDETHDFIDCPDFRLVLSRAMDQIVDLCASNIGSNSLLKPRQASSLLPNSSSTLARFTEIDSQDLENNQIVRLIEVLPAISKESLDILNIIPNIYAETLNETTELKEFSSVIYTTFDGLTNDASPVKL